MIIIKEGSISIIKMISKKDENIYLLFRINLRTRGQLNVCLSLNVPLFWLERYMKNILTFGVKKIQLWKYEFVYWPNFGKEVKLRNKDWKNIENQIHCFQLSWSLGLKISAEIRSWKQYTVGSISNSKGAEKFVWDRKSSGIKSGIFTGYSTHKWDRDLYSIYSRERE